MEQFGRTEYVFGAVVLILNARVVGDLFSSVMNRVERVVKGAELVRTKRRSQRRRKLLEKVCKISRSQPCQLQVATLWQMMMLVL